MATNGSRLADNGAPLDPGGPPTTLWQYDDLVNYGGAPGPSTHIMTFPRQPSEKDSMVSPRTGAVSTMAPPPANGSTETLSRDWNRRGALVRDPRPVLYRPDRPDSPNLSPSAGPGGAWAGHRASSSMRPGSPAPGSSLADSAEAFSQLSPLSRPGHGRTTAVEDSTDPSYFVVDDDQRRPSVTSIATASSQGSQSSTGRVFPKRFQAFFSDDHRERSSTHALESSASASSINGTRTVAGHSYHHRNDSVATTSTADGVATSSPHSRPRSPMPSSEVTPWVYQDSGDIALYGNPPVRQAPAGPDKQRYTVEPAREATSPPTGSSLRHHHHHHHPLHHHHPHKFQLAGHKYSRSREEAVIPKVVSPVRSFARRDSANQTKELPSLPGSAMSSSSTLSGHPLSPSASQNPVAPPPPPPRREQTVPKPSTNNNANPKRFILDMFRMPRHKDESDGGPLKVPPASTRSSQDSRGKNIKPLRLDPAAARHHRKKDGSTSSVENGPSMRDLNFSNLDPGGLLWKDHATVPAPAPAGGGKGLSGLGKPKLLKRYDTAASKDVSSSMMSEPASEPRLFNLDTDLTDMDGIVSQPPLISTPDGGIFTGLVSDEEGGRRTLDDNNGLAIHGAEWNAPDSWAVRRKGDENVSKLWEIDEAGVPAKDAGDGTPYCVRIFRIDSTFATLSASLNSTVDELLRQLGKKSFLQDDLENYQIVMRKHDLQRILESGERPIAIQRRLLEQAGYTEPDRLDEIGREDNSYLCRFTFVPTRLSGYYSLERDPGFGKMTKFSHVDLQGRNLITIPITLHQRSTEIISLNLSRNLSLDVPKDFIQSCINLREIKYTENEAWKLPPSLSLASRLTYLDISNNRLEQLEHAELDKIPGLLSIKAANNMISSIPKYFGRFRTLRTLNISSNCLKQFPEFCCELTSLVDLDISFNSISSLPERIGEFHGLERLLATNNQLLGAFPETFKRLVNLREVDIRFNAISSVEVFSELPCLEQFTASHNSISVFEGTFPRIRTLHLNNNPVTRFALMQAVPNLTTLTLSDAKLAQLQDNVFEKMPNLEKLILDKNHFVTLTPSIGKLRKLEHLSMAKNSLSSLPAEIGGLQILRFLDIRENNLKKLPSEIWCALRLDSLNVSSNVLEAFPKLGVVAPIALGELAEVSATPSQSATTMLGTPDLTLSPSLEDLGKTEGQSGRRPSQGGLLCVGSSPASALGDGSIVSVYGPGGRKASVISRTVSEGTVTPGSRKDSGFSNRMASTFASSLRHLYLADNRLNDDVFDEITLLPELRVLNLSYNDLYDIPPHSLTRWPHLTELYLSGNELASLPSDDFHRQSLLKVLHINGNKFQVLPADLGKIDKLTILDCGSNALKYNVSNWPYDWNWNYNPNLKYLNLSGNKRLEIKPSPSINNRDMRDLTDFSSLQNLRVLGLMDVTLMVPSVPDQTEDRRIRTSGSYAGSMTYGMADSLGKNEHLSTIDMVVPKFGGHEAETLLGMFDGQALSSGGSKVAKFLHENFNYYFTDEMARLQKGTETPVDALRRTYLGLNKELATAANQSLEGTPHHIAHRGSISTLALTQEDANSGGVATVMFLQGMELYVANVGDAQAMLIQSEGGHKMITRKHNPVEPGERKRIREAGGYVSRNGKLNDVLDVSRAFGYIQLTPAVMAAPHIAQISLKEQDEMILIASKELWEYVTPDVVVDVARSERGDLMRAAQKLRDLAIAFGATGKIMVMILGVGDIKLRERQRYRAQSLSMGPSGLLDEQFFQSKRPRRNKDGPDDSVLRRLDQEVDAPTGDVSMVFTDIKNSTLLWETYPVAMQSAIKQHNALMRRQLRIIGGYEVKTEGDAFMVSFPTATSALLWCFTVQSQLLEIEWPAEVLNSVHGQEVLDSDGNVIFRGLSVRMGIHWGAPVCEPDPVTRRMDYFGPMVNRASRISSVAEGGQITVSSDFIGEIQRVLETYHEIDRDGVSGSEDTIADDLLGQAIRRELRSLSLQGFEVKELGERRLKGLENPEYVYLVYPHSLAGRLNAQQQRAEIEVAQWTSNPAAVSRGSQLTFDTDIVWQLWHLTLRLEMLCSTLEDPESTSLKAPETALLERMKSRGGEVTDRFLLNFVEHQVSRVETCSTALYLRHLNQPFGTVNSLLDLARPMTEVLDATVDQFTSAQGLSFKEAKLRTMADQLGIDFEDI